MAKKNNRFEVVFMDGNSIKDGGQREILVDTETGVNYLVWKMPAASRRCWTGRESPSSRQW